MSEGTPDQDLKGEPGAPGEPGEPGIAKMATMSVTLLITDVNGQQFKIQTGTYQGVDGLSKELVIALLRSEMNKIITEAGTKGFF